MKPIICTILALVLGYLTGRLIGWWERRRNSRKPWPIERLDSPSELSEAQRWVESERERLLKGFAIPPHIFDPYNRSDRNPVAKDNPTHPYCQNHPEDFCPYPYGDRWCCIYDSPED